MSFDALGDWGPVVYAAVVILEVIVAPIPGVPVYIAGGRAFGGFVGGLLGAAANATGAMLVCLLVRTVVKRRYDSTSRLIERRGAWIIFALRLNPLTSTDFVSYAAGVTPLPAWKVGLATFFGIAPICFASAYLGDRIPPLGYFVAALSVTYAIVGVVIWRKSASSRASIRWSSTRRFRTAARSTRDSS